MGRKARICAPFFTRFGRAMRPHFRCGSGAARIRAKPTSEKFPKVKSRKDAQRIDGGARVPVRVPTLRIEKSSPLHGRFFVTLSDIAAPSAHAGKREQRRARKPEEPRHAAAVVRKGRHRAWAAPATATTRPQSASKWTCSNRLTGRRGCGRASWEAMFFAYQATSRHAPHLKPALRWMKSC